MSDMRLQMIVSGNNRDLNRMLEQSSANVRRFTQGAAGHFSQLQAHAGRVWSAINGMSTGAKLIGIGAGVGGLRSLIEANLEFEKTLLETKQLAQLTTGQALALRASAISQAKNLLATPLEIAEGMRTLANAGMKFEAIAGTITEAGRAALLFRSSINEVANMDFDIETKFNVDPSELKKAHEILYFHSKDGRFEAKSLSTYAPEYLNAFKGVGIGGMGGLNLVGAITQAVQQAAPATQPGEVATMIKQGLGHIYSEHIDKKLKDTTGIDIHKYAPKDGKFYGKDGVPGLLDLALAMKAAGLTDQFKLQRAGFREEESRKFWLQMMNNAEDIREKMKAAEAGAAAGTGDLDVKEIKEANFGKIKAADVEIERMKLSEPAQAVTKGAGGIASHFAENPLTTLLEGVAVFYGIKKLKGKVPGGQRGGLAEQVAGGAGAAIPVFVTNWPGGPGGMPGPGRVPGNAGGAPEAAAAGGAGAALRGLALLLARAAPLLLLVTSGDSEKKPYDPNWKSNMDEKMRKQGMHREEGWLFDHFVPDAPAAKAQDAGQEKMAAAIKDAFKSLDVRAVPPIEIYLDSHKIAEAVNKVNGRDARRQ